MSRSYRILYLGTAGFLTFSILLSNEVISRAAFFGLMLPATLYLTGRYWKQIQHGAPASLAIAMVLLTYLLGTTFWSEPNSLATVLRYSWRYLETVLFILSIYLVTVDIRRRRLPFREFLQIIVLLAAALSLFSYFIDNNYPERLTGPGLLKHGVQGASVLISIWMLSFLDGREWRTAGSATAVHRNLSGIYRLYSREWHTASLAIAAVSTATLFTYVCLTQSRGPFFSLLLILLLLAITLVKNGFWKSNLTVALFSIGFILIVITGVDNDFIDGLIRRSDSFRLEIWRQTLSCAGEHLWTGVGIATKFSRSEAGIQLYNQLHVWFLHPHNIFISMLYYGGVLGLACFSVFILMLFKGILSSQSNGRRPCQLITLIGVLMLLATDGYRLISAPREIWLIFWLPITFIIGTSCRETEEEQEQNRAVSAYYDRAPLKL